MSINIDCFGTGHQSFELIERSIRKGYDLTPYGINKFLKLTSVDYNRVSSYGHFGKVGLPWEM